MGDRPIQLLVSNQRAYVWNIQDVQRLRVQHHVCGILAGTLPQLGQQNVFLGLPLLLLPEEVVLLVKNKLAVLVDDVKAHRKATPEQAAEYARQRERAIEAQHAQAQRLEAEKHAKMADVIARKREEKRQSRLRQQEERDRSRQTDNEDKQTAFDVFVPDVEPGKETAGPPPCVGGTASATADSASQTSGSSNSRHYTVIIQPTSIDMAWYHPEDATYESLDEARAANLWNYPDTPLQRARCNVFEDLWRKGYFMGGGLRFGGDFLVYPGDTLRYHSHFTLTVLSTPETSIMPMDLVAYGRLATGVKKAHLLATWDEQAQRAEYFSLEWAAFG